MGTAQLQGELWSVRARYWALLHERVLLPMFEVVLTKLHVDDTTSLADIGCGTGMFAMLAAARGATVSGLDASPVSIGIASERTPGGAFVVGEMEELPYLDHTFDVVTGFNAFQYAANPLKALQEATRVAKLGGKVALVFWGDAEDCESDSTLKAVGALMPSPPPGVPIPLALSQPELVKDLLLRTGLTLTATGEVECPVEYPDTEVMLKAFCSAGPVIQAIRHVGEQQVYDVVARSMTPYQRQDGSYRQKNKFRYFITSV
jgi:SAM-dependent methyltransferase